MSLNLNERYLSDEFSKSWTNFSAYKSKLSSTTDPILIYEPFRCFALKNFIDSSQYDDEIKLKNSTNSSSATSTISKNFTDDGNQFLDELREELEFLELNEKKNDLYNFRQSIDLQNVDTPAIVLFRNLFQTRVKKFLQELTGIELNDQMAMTASAYGHGDHLLCHDDELENRRIAYTYYLTPNWTEEDGGRLDLFSSDDNLQPTKIVESILPEENMLAFFEVVPKSFHQVSEVTSKEKVRWSINGWFHGTPIDRPPRVPIDLRAKPVEPCSFEYDELFEWINVDYFDDEVQAGIREQFEEKSEIQLQRFLQDDKYKAVSEELRKADLNWTKKGPWNRRNYVSVDDLSLLNPERFPNLWKCIQLMHSEAVYVLLSQLTNMHLHPLYKEDGETGVGELEGEPVSKKSKKDIGEGDGAGTSSSTNGNQLQHEEQKEPSPCEMELRKFEPGSYTVLSDDDFKVGDESLALNAQLFFTSQEWDTKHGGYTCYIEKDSSDELLTVTPFENALALVCSEQGIQKFVKYINRNASDDFVSNGNEQERAGFIDISMVYHETRAIKK